MNPFSEERWTGYGYGQRYQPQRPLPTQHFVRTSIAGQQGQTPAAMPPRLSATDPWHNAMAQMMPVSAAQPFFAAPMQQPPAPRSNQSPTRQEAWHGAPAANDPAWG